MSTIQDEIDKGVDDAIDNLEDGEQEEESTEETETPSTSVDDNTEEEDDSEESTESEDDDVSFDVNGTPTAIRRSVENFSNLKTDEEKKAKLAAFEKGGRTEVIEAIKAEGLVPAEKEATADPDLARQVKELTERLNSVEKVAPALKNRQRDDMLQELIGPRFKEVLSDEAFVTHWVKYDKQGAAIEDALEFACMKSSVAKDIKREFDAKQMSRNAVGAGKAGKGKVNLPKKKADISTLEGFNDPKQFDAAHAAAFGT